MGRGGEPWGGARRSEGGGSRSQEEREAESLVELMGEIKRMQLQSKAAAEGQETGMSDADRRKKAE